MHYLPKPRHLWKTAKQLVAPLLAALTIMAVVAVVVISVFGWGRIKADFYPLDRSYVGPNLVASVVIVVGVAALNEYKTVRKDEEEGKSLKTVLEDAVEEIAAPVTTFEESVAEEVEADLAKGEQSAGTS